MIVLRWWRVRMARSRLGAGWAASRRPSLAPYRAALDVESTIDRGLS